MYKWEVVSNMSKVLRESHMPEVDRLGPLSGTAATAGRDHKRPFWIDFRHSLSCCIILCYLLLAYQIYKGISCEMISL